MSETINVWCENEERVVGTLPLRNKQRLDLTWVWHNFVPASLEYRLGKISQRDGEALRCPHCMGELSVQGAVLCAPEKAPKREGGLPPVGLTRDELRARAAKDFGGSARVLSFSTSRPMPIVLGATTLHLREVRR